MTQITTNVGAVSWIKPLARAGLIAKGIVYTLLGILAFMAAFEIGDQQDDKADKQAVFETVRDQGGNVLLGILILGLCCYSIWRITQALTNADRNNNESKGLKKRLRYLFSGIAYASVAFYASKLLFNNGKDSDGSSNNEIAGMLSHSWGQWAVGILALITAGVGVYQIYYGLSEKYRKHVSKLNLHTTGYSLLLRSGKIGYVSRGVVWILLGWLLLKAAWDSRSDEAGTGKAFQFLESTSYGSYLLGALGLGLACYGFFNFVRSRYETNF